MRWINTKVVIDMESGETLEKNGYWHDGPVALCDMSSIGPLMGLITGGIGATGNIINGVETGQQVNKLKQQENLTPQQLSSKVTSAEQPLSQSLLNAVGNQVQADVASRGLAESPGVFATTEAQALAPYQQQQQQVALQLILTQMGIPAETIAALTKSGSANISQIMSLLSGTKFPGTNPATAGGVPTGPPSQVGDILYQLQQAQTPSSPGITAYTPPPDFASSFGSDT